MLHISTYTNPLRSYQHHLLILNNKLLFLKVAFPLKWSYLYIIHFKIYYDTYTYILKEKRTVGRTVEEYSLGATFFKIEKNQKEIKTVSVK